LKVLKSIEDFLNRFPEAKQQGNQTTLDEIERLPDIVRNNMPDFWKTALTKFPLCNLEIGVPSDFGQPQLKGLNREDLPLVTIQFLSPLEISESSTEIFPGFVLFKKSLLSRNSFLCIANEIESTQEGIFISLNKEDPKPLLVFHDYGETKKELIKNSESISSSLTMLFKEAFIKNRNRIVSKDKLILAKELISVLMEELRHSALSTPERVPESNSMSEQEILGAIIESATHEITDKSVGYFMERMSGIDELSILNKQELWNEIHEIYDVCDLHKGDLYCSEAYSMI
jgi:hypothetical protein